MSADPLAALLHDLVHAPIGKPSLDPCHNCVTFAARAAGIVYPAPTDTALREAAQAVVEYDDSFRAAFPDEMPMLRLRVDALRAALKETER